MLRDESSVEVMEWAVAAASVPVAAWCVGCDGSGQCAVCAAERKSAVRRRCEECGGTGTCASCDGSGTFE